MAYYVRGNLAMRSEHQSQQQPRYVQIEKKIIKRSALSVREKLLYLGTIFFCFALALFLISRHAYIYNTNLKVQEMKRKTAALHNEVSKLKVEREKLSNWQRIEKEAKQNGLIFPETPAEIEVYKQQIGN